MRTSSPPIWGRPHDGAAARGDRALRLLRRDAGAVRPRPRGRGGRHHDLVGGERGRQDHGLARALRHGAGRGRDPLRRPADCRAAGRADRAARHRPCAAGARHLRAPDRRGEFADRRHDPARSRGDRRRCRARPRLLPAPQGTPAPTGRHALGRRAADARGRPRHDAAPAPDAARRALVRAGAADRAGAVRDPAHAQPRGKREHPAGRAERLARARSRRPRLSDRDRAPRHQGPGARHPRRRDGAALVPGVLDAQFETHTHRHPEEATRASAWPSRRMETDSVRVAILRDAGLRPAPQDDGGAGCAVGAVMNWELLLHQVLAGLATGGIYACIALAVVMIYQAIDHLNFAQGEMAMFSTFIAWQLIAWGCPYWVAFVLTIALSFVGGLAIERIVFKPIHDPPVLSHIVVFIALFSILNSLAGWIWDYTIKDFPTPFGTRSLIGSGLISAHDGGMIGVTLVLL